MGYREKEFLFQKRKLFVCVRNKAVQTGKPDVGVFVSRETEQASRFTRNRKTLFAVLACVASVEKILVFCRVVKVCRFKQHPHFIARMKRPPVILIHGGANRFTPSSKTNRFLFRPVDVHNDVRAWRRRLSYEKECVHLISFHGFGRALYRPQIWFRNLMVHPSRFIFSKKSPSDF